MNTEKKKTGDHFYKILGEGRNVSRKKLTLQAQDTNTNPLLQSTTSSFYLGDKKSESYLTLIQMLKSDLLQIQDMINNNSQDIKMFKLLSKVPGLSKKLSEIEEQNSINYLIDKITEDSHKLEKISKIYNCKDNKQLIQKIFLELSFNELLLKKIYDYFILMKLSLHKDDTYQESLSKIIPIKSFIDKTINKINDKNKNHHIKNNINNDNILIDKQICESILNIKTLEEFLNLENNDNINDKNIPDIIKHIIQIINEYFLQKNKYISQTINNNDNINSNDEDEFEYKINLQNLKNKSELEKFEIINNELINIIKKYKNENEEKKHKTEELINDIKEKEKIIESLNEKQNNDIISMKNEFENEKKIMMEKYDIINEKNINMEKEYNLLKEENYKLIEELNKYKEKEKEKENNNANVEKDKIITLEKANSELNKTITELNNKINELNTKIKELESKKNKNIDINQVMKDSEIVKLVNNYDTQLKKIGNDLANKNKDEVKNLENKFKSLQAKYDMILLERESLKKNIIYLKGKKYDPDSYEEVLKEQFETMRNAFIQKIDDLNEELNDIKRNSRIQIYQLELELKENVRLKNNFLKQIISLQSQLDSLNK